MSRIEISDEDGDFTEPAVPYQAHSDTSRAAAEAMSASMVAMQEGLWLDRLRDAGLACITDGEMLDMQLMDEQAVRRARVALVRKGAVCDSGGRRMWRKGRRQTMWILTELKAEYDAANPPPPAPAPSSASSAAPPTSDASMFMDIEEGKYNARDVLGMCRVFSLLVNEVERTGTAEVYFYDRQMAWLATQMTRQGMPVDLDEKDRVGTRLREIRTKAIAELGKYVTGQYREEFIKWVAHYSAAKPRKADPKTGDLNPATNLPHSAETSMLARVEIRRTAFLKHFEQWELVQRIRNPLAPEADVSLAFDTLYDLRKATLKGIARKMGSTWDDPEVQQKWLDKCAEKGLNFGAKIQQAAILRAAGVPLLKVTEKTALPKISKETLEEFGYHAAAREMLNFILTSAALRTFIDGLPINMETRAIHPDWTTTKITGRWGSSPNVQNWSKRAGGGAENLRRMIAAPEGFIFVGADQKQLEARLIAAASQDPFLIDIFQRNADIHGELAGVAFGEQWAKAVEVYVKHKPKNKDAKKTGIGCGLSKEHPYCELCEQRDKMRDLTKRLEYGAFYGGSIDTLWKSVVKDFPEIKPAAIAQFMQTLGQKMAGVIAWRQSVLAEATRTGEIRSPILGRREVFPLAHLGRVEPTVAYNFIPQSGGADLWAIGAAKFLAKWDQTAMPTDDRYARIIHNGHDSVLILTREDCADEVEDDVHECWEMEWAGVPFLMDCKRGKRWSEV